MCFMFYCEIHNTKCQIIFMINETDIFKSLIGSLVMQMCGIVIHIKLCVK